MPASERWSALTHWIVVTTPTELVRMYPWTGDDGEPGPRTAEEAAERALEELREELEDEAGQGAAPVDDIEVLVFERGRESGRFKTALALETLEPACAKDWTPDA